MMELLKVPDINTEKSIFLPSNWDSVSKNIHDYSRNFLIAVTFLAASRAISNGRLLIATPWGFGDAVFHYLLLIFGCVLLTLNIFAILKFLLVTFKANQIPSENFGKFGFLIFVLLLASALIMLMLYTAIVMVGFSQIK